jgi:hypothetical protein
LLCERMGVAAVPSRVLGRESTNSKRVLGGSIFGSDIVL